MPTARAVLGADRLRGAETLVGVGRRHPDVHDRDVRAMLAGRLAGGHRRRRPGRRPRSPRRPAGARHLRARRIESSARTSRRVMRRSTSARIAAPGDPLLGDEARGRARRQAPPVGPRIAARGQHDERRRAIDREARGRPRTPRRRAGRCRAARSLAGATRAAARPDAPSTASPITTKPSASRTSRAWSRKRGSSSMIRIVLMPAHRAIGGPRLQGSHGGRQ